MEEGGDAERALRYYDRALELEAKEAAVNSEHGGAVAAITEKAVARMNGAKVAVRLARWRIEFGRALDSRAFGSMGASNQEAIALLLLALALGAVLLIRLLIR